MIDTDRLFAKTREIPIFSPLTDEELQSLLLQCQIALYLKDKVIFRESALGDSMMVVLQGSVSLRCSPEQGVTVEVAQLGEGAILGEMAVIDPAPRAATAVATSNAVLLVMQKEVLDRLLTSDHPLASKVMRQVLLLLAARFRTMEDRIEQLFVSRIGERPAGSPAAAWAIAPME